MRLNACHIVVFTALLLVACDSAPSNRSATSARDASSTSRSEAAATDIPAGQLPQHVEPLHYTLDLTINPDQLRYEGSVEIDIELKAPKREFYLHGKDLVVPKVTARLANGTLIKGAYNQVNSTGVARLSFEQQIPTGRFRVLIPFSAAFETSPNALTAMSDNGARYVWSQFEEISARRAFPCFDEPRFKTPFDITITSLERDVVVSNTLPVSQQHIANGVVKTTFATTAPLPTYLVALVVGPYDVLNGPPVPASKIREASLPLRAVTVKGKSNQARFALAATGPLVATLETYFAAPFPYPKLDIIAPPNFAAGGMENAGAITYTERGILLAPQAPVQQRRYFELLHAHELSHQWFGDLVTPQWWIDIWLNEAFASWSGVRAAAATWPQDELDRETTRSALSVMDRDALASARSIRQPIKTNDDIFNAFDGLTYDKGAAVLQMFEGYIGPDIFREGVRSYMRKYAHGNASTDDFLTSLAEASRKPEIVQAINTFLNQPGVPLVKVETSCTKKDLDVRISQSPYAAQSTKDLRSWTLPVCMRELGRSRPLPCTLLGQKPASFTVRNLCGVALMPNLNGIGYYRFTTGKEEWSKLAASLKSMTPAEQLSTIHSLRSAFRSGDTDAATYVAGLRNALTSGNWDVVELSTAFLSDMRDNLLVPSATEPMRDMVAKWMERPLSRTGTSSRPGERVSTTLLRSALANWSVRFARDKGALETYSASGLATLKILNGPRPDTMRLDELTPVSIWAAINTGGEDAARQAIAALGASKDAEQRIEIIRALAAARDAAAKAAIREYALSGQLRARELSTYLREAFADAETRTETWSWLRRNFDRVVETTGIASQARLLDLPSQLCSTGIDREVDAFFSPLVPRIEGGPRKLANTLETIRTCLSWRAAREREIAAAFLPPGKH